MTAARRVARGATGAQPLPSPGVSIGPALVRRFGAFASRLAAAREREEVGRRRALQGEGEEFVGHRPYRAGDDLRHLDWSLLARRGDRPFVRVHRSSASERWLVALDASASMGVGRPGKLQSAAEAAGAAMALGLRLGSSIALVAPGDGAEEIVELRRTSDLQRGLDALRAMVAGSSTQSGWVGEDPDAREPTSGALSRCLEGAGRVLLFSDFLDVDPRWISTLAGGRRRVHLGQVFAGEEWDPSAAAMGGAVWVDPERPGSRWSSDGAGSTDYLERLEGFVGGWARFARNHRMSHAVWTSSEGFEDHLPDLLR